MNKRGLGSISTIILVVSVMTLTSILFLNNENLGLKGITGRDVTIQGIYLPEVYDLIIVSTSGHNRTADNLTASFSTSDLDLEQVKSILDWRLNGNSIAVLNMPFENYTKVNETALDYSIFGNNGSVHGAKFNNSVGNDGTGAYVFNGSADITVPESSSTHFNGEATISFWFYRNSDADSVLITKSNDTSSVWDLRITNNMLNFSIAGVYAEGATTLLTNTWYFVAANKNSIYLSGVNDATIPSLISYSADQPDIIIGSNGTDLYFNGTIDELKIYNRTLSQSQIENIASYDLHSQETEEGDNWSVAVTPNDGTRNGLTIVSNVVTIISNGKPNITELRLLSTHGTNLTTENLTAYWNSTDADENPIVNITDWRTNGISIATLNMPFEANPDSATSTFDYSTRNNTASVVGATWTQNGYLGGAYSFSGNEDYITLNSSGSAIGRSENGTIMFWVKSTSSSPNIQAIYDEFTTKYQDNPGDSAFEIKRVGTNLRFDNMRDATYDVLETPISDWNQWNHVAVVWTDTYKKIYVNGILESSASAPGSTNEPIDATRLGKLDVSGYSLNGAVDELKIYDKALSSEQIAIDATSGNYILSDSETKLEENWSVAITPNDGIEDGLMVLSNNITITRYCIEPINDMNVANSTAFCPGTYNLPDGINITSDNVVLSCSGAMLNGSGYNAGIYGEFSNLTILGCAIGNYNKGISVIASNQSKNISDINILNNSLFNNTYGVLVSGGSFGSTGDWNYTYVTNFTISNNTVFNNYYGYYVSGYTEGGNIDNNVAFNNTYGIRLSGSSGCFGSAVTFNSNGVVSNNIVHDNSFAGIEVSTTYNYVLSQNNISNNPTYALYFFAMSYNNTIVSNSFINNSGSGISFPYLPSCPSGSGGNYVYNNIYANNSGGDIPLDSTGGNYVTNSLKLSDGNNILDFGVKGINITSINQIFIGDSMASINSSVDSKMRSSVNVTFNASCAAQLYSAPGFFTNKSYITGATIYTNHSGYSCSNGIMKFNTSSFSTIFANVVPNMTYIYPNATNETQAINENDANVSISMQGVNQSFNVTATDTDDAFLTFSWFVNGIQQFIETIVSGLSSIFNFLFSQTGQYNITVVVNDSVSNDTFTWFINVTCVEPYNGMYVNNNTLFCPGAYNLPNGIRINASDIVVECNGTILNGTNSFNGINILNLNNVTILDCGVVGYANGIELSASNYNTIFNNTVFNNDEGIFVASSSIGNNISFNTIFANDGDGIILSSSNNSIISNNIIANNLASGIEISVSSNNNSAFGNIVSNNTEGIRVHGSKYNSLFENIANNNSLGIDVYLSSYYNLISNNIVANNSQAGLQASLSSNNSFINNTLLSNSLDFLTTEVASNNTLILTNNQNQLAFYNKLINFTDIDNFFINDSIVAVNTTAEPSMNTEANVSFVSNCSTILYSAPDFFTNRNSVSGATRYLDYSGLTCNNNIMNFTTSHFSTIFADEPPCYEPTSGMNVTKNITLCPGTYNLTDGLNVSGTGTFVTCNNTILNGTSMSNEGVMFLSGSVDSGVINCTIRNFNYGVLIAGVNNFLISGNNISGSSTGIHAVSSAVVSNHITNTTIAIYLRAYAQYYSNVISNSTYGVYATGTPVNMFIENNSVTGCSHGAYLNGGGDGSRLTANTFNFNNNGIYITTNANSYNLSYNSISNSTTGAYLQNNNHNLFFNSFDNNTLDIFTPGSYYNNFRMSSGNNTLAYYYKRLVINKVSNIFINDSIFSINTTAEPTMTSVNANVSLVVPSCLMNTYNNSGFYTSNMDAIEGATQYVPQNKVCADNIMNFTVFSQGAVFAYSKVNITSIYPNATNQTQDIDLNGMNESISLHGINQTFNITGSEESGLSVTINWFVNGIQKATEVLSGMFSSIFNFLFSQTGQYDIAVVVNGSTSSDTFTWFINIECIEPYNGMYVNNNTLFCPGTYDLPNGIIINASNIIVQGNNTILNGSSANDGILINAKNNVTIASMNIMNYANGIDSETSNYFKLLNSNISNSGYAIYFWNSNNASILSNRFNSQNYGVATFGNSKDMNISSNFINNSASTGLSMGDFKNYLTNNIVDNSAIGIALISADNSVVVENTITNGNEGISLSSATKFTTVSNNILSSNSQYGIHFSLSTNNTMSNNTIMSSGIKDIFSHSLYSNTLIISNGSNSLKFNYDVIDIIDMDNLFIDNSIVAVNTTAEPSMNTEANVSFFVSNCGAQLYNNSGFFTTIAEAEINATIYPATEYSGKTCSDNIMNFTTNHFSTIFAKYVPSSSTEGKTGGGGRGETTTCISNISCDAWGACINGRQKRICSDLNNCTIQYLDARECVVEIKEEPKKPINEQPIVTPSTTPVKEPVAPEKQPVVFFWKQDWIIATIMGLILALVVSSLIVIDRIIVLPRRRLNEDFDVRTTRHIIKKTKSVIGNKQQAIHIYNDAVRAYQALNEEKKKIFEKELKELKRKII